MEDYRDVQARASGMFQRRIVFLTGVSRTALTWVGEALDAHPGIICKGESHVADWLIPVIEGGLGQYNGKIGQLRGTLETAGFHPDLPGYVQGDLDYLIRTAYSLALSRWDGGDNAAVICDRTPETVFFLDRLIQAVPEAKVIHIVRDGRDEAISAWDFNNMGAMRETFQQRYPSFETFTDAFAQTWVKGTGSGKQFGRKYWDRYFEFRFEDLVANPGPGIGALLQYLEQPVDPNTLGACVEAAGMVPIGQVGVWRELFDPGTEATFKSHAGELLKLLGYPI